MPLAPALGAWLRGLRRGLTVVVPDVIFEVEAANMVYAYRVTFETDPDTKAIVVSLPALNYTADFGRTVEEALARLQTLAQGFLELLAERGEPIPLSDLPGDGVYLLLNPQHEPLPA